MSSRCVLALLLLAPALCVPSLAQDVGGTIFEDRDADGIHDPGEPGLDQVPVRLFGGGGAGDQTVLSGADGAYSFSPGNGCYLISPTAPAGWRLGTTRADGFPDSTPGYQLPVGQPRFSRFDGLIERLETGSLRYSALGDSIAYNFNLCFYPESFWYHQQLRSRLICAAPSAAVQVDEAAVKGEHSDDLLVDDTADLNNVFRMIEIQPQLISISMIGNDLLDVDPGPNPGVAASNRAVVEVLDARRNLQEALSAMISEIPGAHIALNTLYDNEAYNCYSGDAGAFHRAWVPIVDRMLRDLAWGQRRRVSTIEVAAEFAQEDQLGGCTGFDGLICRDLFQLDTIHPTNNGYDVIREKLWEAAGGVSLGGADVLGRDSIDGASYGYLRRVRRLLPSTWETRNGAVVSAAEAALDDGDGGTAARVVLGSADEELRLAGFADWFDEVRIVRVIAGVRYRTTGTVNDDFYRMEASIDEQFRAPPGFVYTPTQWNFYTPIVGGGGPNQPVENPDYPDARLLVVPEVAGYREVSAALTKDPVLPPDSGVYEWPPITHEELATTTIRVVAAPVAGTPGNDAYEIELDHAWIDLYGWETSRPPEVEALRLAREADGTLDFEFDPLQGAQRYNLYVGRLGLLGQGYDHGDAAPAGPFCDAATQPEAGGRLRTELAPAQQDAGNLYFLVTAHVDDVESPAGSSSDGREIDRSQSDCR